MLKPEALGNSFAVSTIIIYIYLFILNRISPPFFELFINSQFLGADISSQISTLSAINFLGSLIAVGVLTWVFGYLLATVYNKTSNSKK